MPESPVAGDGVPGPDIPSELSPRRIARRLLQFAVVGVVIGLVVLTGPGLGSVRERVSHATVGWLVLGVALEVVSTLCYVLVFRAVFCRRMSWRLSYQIGMSEQGANSVLSVSGAGGLALGVWALRRGGMGTEHIARRTVAFFFLTSLANVTTLFVLALLYLVGVEQHDPDPILTYVFGGLSLIATMIVIVGLPRLRPALPADPGAGRLTRLRKFARNSLGQGVRDALQLLRERPLPVLVGSFGVMGFDVAVLGVSCVAFHYTPSVPVLVLAYLIGQLGGNLPIPGGVGGLDAGLIGVFALYHQSLPAASAAVLTYHAISLWVPALLGSVAFLQLRRTLERETQPAAICMPLADPIEPVRLPAGVGTGPD